MVNDKIPANYLVFDDDDETYNQYRIKVKIDGYDCNPIHINPTHFIDPETESFRSEEFKTEIFEKTKGINVSLILTDWNMSLPNLFGWDVIGFCLEAKPKLTDRQFLIYSSDIKKASKYILNKIAAEVCKTPEAIEDLSLHNFVSNILNLKVKFWKRDGTQFDEIRTLLQTESKTISNIVLNSLSTLGQATVVNFGHDEFDGKSIGNILNEHQSPGLGLRFIKEIIALSVANFTEIND